MSSANASQAFYKMFYSGKKYQRNRNGLYVCKHVSYFHITDATSSYSFTKEIERMNFDLNKAWRYTEINKDFG